MSWLKKADRCRFFLHAVEAAGLSRQVQHLKDEVFGIVSASRFNLTPEQNEQRTQELRQKIRSIPLGFLPALGVWEGGGEEDGLLIPGIKEADLQKLAAFYQQDSYIYGENGHFKIVKTTDGTILDEGSVDDRWHNIGKADDEEKPKGDYTEIDGHRWQFRRKPQNVEEENVVAFTSGKHKWSLVAKLDDTKGQPYFFLLDPSVKYYSPRSGIASHDGGKTAKLNFPVEYFSAYFLIPKVKK